MNAVCEHYRDEVLRLFNTGRLLDASLEEQIADHLGGCDRCASRLAELGDDGDPLIQWLRKPNPLQPMIEEEKLLPEASLTSTASLRDDPSQEVLRSDRIPALSSRQQLPEWIGPYFVIEELSSGGFGTVYCALDYARNRQVAIKLPHASRFATGPARQAFINEARKAMRLAHPHIVPVYDCQVVDVVFSDHIERDRCIIVMKYIRGQSLQKALDEGKRFSRRAAARLVADVADALHYTHSQREPIIHRDVKPGNILLDKRNVPYLADFGLALSDAEQPLHAGECMGTLPYMSPEQTRGRANHLDGRSDVWNLGVVLYELLAKKRPFLNQQRYELFDEIRNRPHPALRRHDPTIPHQLEAICDRCLHKEVGKRYATSAQLASDLRRFVRLRNSRDLVLVACAALALVLLAFSLHNNTGTPFLDREPTPIIRNITNPSSVWRPVVDKQRFEVESPGFPAMAAFGEIEEAMEYRIRVKLHQNGWVGFSGIVFAIQPVPHTQPNTALRCYAVRVGRSDADLPLNVMLEEFALESTSGLSYRLVSSEQLAAVPLSIPADGLMLEVRVVGQTCQILLQGHAVTFDRPLELSWTTGRFGLTSFGEHCVFEDGSVLLPRKAAASWRTSSLKR